MAGKHDERLELAIRQVTDFVRGEKNGTRVTREDIEIDEVTGIRRQLKLSQQDFASMMGISVATLRNWEQGRRQPTGPARKLLNVLRHHPEAVLEVSQ